MLNPKKSEPIPDDEPYSCPDETTGNYYSGPTRVSLFETGTGRVINTIEIHDPDSQEHDEFTIPYEIRPGYYYRVDSTDSSKASKPTILDFRDFNGDGDTLEFALYFAPACMGLQTTLIGYSRKSDSVIQYPIKIEYRQGGKQWEVNSAWLEYLFVKKPVSPKHWKYAIDYRGRAGALETFDIKYDRKTEQFTGSCIVSDAEE